MRCPVCRADNNEGPNCRRCRADLSPLFRLEEQHAALLTEARQRAASQDWPEAVRLAEQAHSLRGDAEAAELVAAGCLMQHRFDQAWQWYRQAASQKKSPLPDAGRGD